MESGLSNWEHTLLLQKACVWLPAPGLAAHNSWNSNSRDLLASWPLRALPHTWFTLTNTKKPFQNLKKVKKKTFAFYFQFKGISAVCDLRGGHSCVRAGTQLQAGAIKSALKAFYMLLLELTCLWTDPQCLALADPSRVFKWRCGLNSSLTKS